MNKSCLSPVFLSVHHTRTENPKLVAPDSEPAHACYAADGNGNVTCLIYTNQQIAARYGYDPFGNTLIKLGPLAEGNLCRFSSMEHHEPAELILYVFRPYLPGLQRWLNRDPINELGHELLRRLDGGEIAESDGYLESVENLDTAESNEYAFVANNPLTFVDPFGLERRGVGVGSYNLTIDAAGCGAIKSRAWPDHYALKGPAAGIM